MLSDLSQTQKDKHYTTPTCVRFLRGVGFIGTESDGGDQGQEREGEGCWFMGVSACKMEKF